MILCIRICVDYIRYNNILLQVIIIILLYRKQFYNLNHVLGICITDVKLIYLGAARI